MPLDVKYCPTCGHELASHNLLAPSVKDCSQCSGRFQILATTGIITIQPLPKLLPFDYRTESKRSTVDLIAEIGQIDQQVRASPRTDPERLHQLTRRTQLALMVCVKLFT